MQRTRLGGLLRVRRVIVCVLVVAFLCLQQLLVVNYGGGSARSGAWQGAEKLITVEGVREAIKQLNAQEFVLNENKFGPLQNDSLVIVVQEHSRIAYLQNLIDSFRDSRGIENALLVFSHDVFDPKINELIRSIDFCKVMQIFYPHSIQTHPHVFPGENPTDCLSNMTKQQAQIANCTNVQHPDMYGHYRTASITQCKHHWWWKANRVFDQLEVTKNHSGLVLFLEEDHYVAEDFIYVLRLMQQSATERCPKCNIFSLGSYGTVSTNENISQLADLRPWASNQHNMGMAFNRSTWRKILNCSEDFCKYDDYNWDWSLQRVSNFCIKDGLYAIVMRAPRVFHTGKCGMHHNKADCNATLAIVAVQRMLSEARGHFFPANLTINVLPVSGKLTFKENGGWGDVRDHQLCLNISVH